MRLMKVVRTAVVGATAAMLFASIAFAQSENAPRTSISFAGGAGSSNFKTGVAVGGSWLFDVNDFVSLEAQGMYLDQGAGADAVNVTGSLLVNVMSGRKRIVPYAALGGGLYRTSFDLANPAFFGPNGPQFAPGSLVCPAPGSGSGPGPGSGFGSGTGTCPATVAGYWGVGQLPGFYARRLGPMAVPVGGVWDARSFTDPAVSLGGGFRFSVNEHLMVRPDIRALLVLARGEAHAVGVYGIQLGYRF